MSGSGNPTFPPTLTTREEDILKEYSSSLEDLTVNSKPLINMLTMLAEESIAFAHVIVIAIEKHLHKISSDIKLPVLYLIDSIMKNVGKPYPSLFTQNIVSTFCSVFEQVDEKTRAQMFKLRHTWNNMFPAKKMYALDARVHNIDPAWPITAPPTTSPSTLSRIHLNPKFFQGGGGGGSGSAGGTSPQTVTTATTTPVTTPAVVSAPAKPTDEGSLSEAALRENLLKKKKELLELQQKKLELELLQTKKKLEEQEKQLEKTTVLLKPETVVQPTHISNSQKQRRIKRSNLYLLKVPNTSSLSSSNSDVPVTTRRSSRSSSSYSKSDSKRSSRSQRRAAMEAAIAAANERNSLVINSLPNTPSTITNSSVTAGSVSGMSPKSKPCAPVAPVVTTAAPSFPPLPSGKVLCPSELLNTGTTTVPVTSVKIAPVSSQLIKAARSRDPRLRSISSNEVASVAIPVPISVAPNVRASVTNRTPLSVTSVTANSITTPSTKNCLSNTNVPVATTSSTPISIVAPLPQTPPPPLPSSKIVPNRPISVPVTTIPLPTIKADVVTAVTKSNVITTDISTSVITSTASSVSNSVAVNKTDMLLTDCLADKMKLPNLSSPPKSKIGSSDAIDNTKEGSKKVEIKNKVKMKKDKKLHRSKDSSKNNTGSINKNKKEKEKVSDDLISIKEKDKTKYNKLKFISISDDCPISITGDDVICYGKQKSKSKSDRKNENKDFIKLVEDKTFVKDFKTQSKLSEKVNLEGQFVLVVEAENIKNNETSNNKSDESNLEKLSNKPELEKSPKKSSKEKDGKKSPKSSSPRIKHPKSNKSQKSPVKSIHKIHEKNVISQDEKDDEISSSPPPPVTSNEVSDKFKEVRASSIQRLKQCARHREPSVSPPPEPKDIPIPVDTDASSTTTPVIQSSSITSGDTDLRVPPVDEIKPPVVPAHESKKDIDLRALTAAGSTIPTASELLTQTTKRPSVEREPDLPPMKKSKMDKLDELFGREDTDMRQELGPPLPSPPPPPIISPLTEVDENSEERSWAKYKQGKPDVYKSLHRHPSRDESSFGPYRRKRESLDRLGRPLLYHRSTHGSGGGNQYSRSGRHRHEQVYRDQDSARNHSHGNNRDLTHYNYILREAEEQFKSGTVPISTYNRVVKEVITMNEQTKLDEAIRRDELQTNHWKRHHRDSLSPGSASAYERNSNLANSECNSEYDYQGDLLTTKKSRRGKKLTTSPSKGAVDEDLESDVRKSESEVPEEDHDNKSGENTGQIIKYESEYDPGEPIMTNNNEEESCQEEGKEESRVDVKESLTDTDLRTLQPSVDVSVDLKQLDSAKTIEFDEKPEDISDLKYEAVSSSEHSEEFDLCDDIKAEEVYTDEKPNISVKDEIEIEEHLIENKFDVKQENDVVVSSDIDARIIPSSLTENDSKMNLIPPPFPKEILKSLDDCKPNILGIPDPAIIASKDTDLRIGMRPIGAIGAVPMSVSVSPKKCIPMETEFNENSNPDADMDVDNHCLRKSPVELPVRNLSEKPNDFDESSRGHSKQKKFPRYKDTDDYKQHKSPPQGSNFGSAPWDRQQGQQPQPQNMPTPGMVGPNPWMRPLLRPPPAMIIRAGMDSSRFNPRWPPTNSSGPPPLMPPNFQQPLPSMQQIPPIRPPPPPPAGMFVESDMMGNVPFGPPRPFGGFPPIQPMDLAPADPAVLDSIMQDPMRTIIIDGVARDIRYYGDTAVVFMNFDDPREILFQGPPRHVTINDEDTVLLSFNAPFKDIVIDGQTHRVRFGGPTREFCIDDSFYECFFGGPPITVDLGGDSLVKIQLEGPPPQVKIGNSRKDLVVGKINLIVDAKGVFPIYLDPKPQTFEIEGVPYILRFVNALETVVINGTAFTFEYGGLPQPIHARGKRHFLRFTSLPQNVKPGYVDIYSMEGCRRGSSPPCQPPTGMPPKDFNPLNQDSENSHDAISLTSFSNPVSPPTQELISDGPPMTKHDTDSQSAVDANIGQSKSPEQSQNQSNNINPLDIFATLMTPVVKPPTSGFSYSVELPSVDSAVTTQPEGTTKTSESKPKDSIPFLGSGQINITELFQRLVASGIVPGSSKNTATVTESTDEKSPATTESNTVIKPTDFHKPETLRVRQPGLISILFSGIQCSSCGVRFPPEQTIKYSQHLDWHFRQNRRDRDSSRKAQSRKWYYDVSDWIQFEEIEDLEERAQSWFESQAQQNLPIEDEASVDIPSVPCENGLMDVECEMCKDKFEQFYNEDKEEWHLRRAVKIDDKIYHPLCYEDYLTSLNAPAPELDETKPEEIEPAVETPYEDEDDDVIIQEIEPKPIIIELIKDDDEEEEEAALKAAEEAKKALEISDEKDIDDESRLDIEDGAEKIDLNVTVSEDMDTQTKDDEDEENETVQEVSSSSELRNIITNIKQEPLDDVEEIESIIDLESVVIKKEKLDEDYEQLLPEPVVDTTHTIVACSIDGNVELDDTSAMQVAAPSKIKINISKPVNVNQSVQSKEPVNLVDESSMHEDSLSQPPTSSSIIPLNMVEPLQPPPPGEEPGPLHLKPRLVGKKLTELPPVSKGTELSGLCSIM